MYFEVFINIHSLQSSTKSKPHGSGNFSKTKERIILKIEVKESERVLEKSPDPCGLLSSEDCSLCF